MSWIRHLMSEGYTIPEIKALKLSDLELMIKATEAKVNEEEKETTLDKAFPFLFG